jgi:hypothetical protein
VGIAWRSSIGMVDPSGAGFVFQLRLGSRTKPIGFVNLFALSLLLLCGPQSYAGFEQAVVAVCVEPSCNTGTCAGFLSRGSGVALGRDRANNRLLILTAAHVVRDRAPGSRITVFLADRWQTATVRAITKQNPNWDLALLEVDCREPWPCLSLVRNRPDSGTEVSLCGYEGGLRWIHKRGLFGHRDSYWLYWNGATPREGTSGGALVAQGALLAIVSGYTTDGARQGVGQNAEAIASFLQGALGYIPGESTNLPVAQDSSLPSPQAAPVRPAPNANADATLQLGQQIAMLQQELLAIKGRPIIVEIYDPETRTVKSRSFPAGEPIRLQLPTGKASNVGTSK